MASATVNSKSSSNKSSTLSRLSTRKYLSLSASSLFPGTSKLEVLPESPKHLDDKSKSGKKNTVVENPPPRGVQRERTFLQSGKDAEEKRKRAKASSADKSLTLSVRGGAGNGVASDDVDFDKGGANIKRHYTQKANKYSVERRATKGRADDNNSKARIRQLSQPDLADPAALHADLMKKGLGVEEGRCSSEERMGDVNATLRTKKLAEETSDTKTWRRSGIFNIRWFKNITEQAETRTREAAKAVRKPSAVVASNGTTSTSSSSEPRESRSHDGNDKDVETSREDGAHSFSESLSEKKIEGEERGGQGGGSLDNVASVDSVEVLHIEQPSLVQPSEVIISSAVCMEQLKTEVHQQPQQLGSSSGEPVGSLLEALKEKIEETMKQKQNLTADIFQIPISDYYNIADMVSESGESTSDIKELLLVSLTQVDLLTQLINKRLSPEPEAGTNFEMTSRRQKIQSDESEYSTENDDESLPTPTPEGSRASDPALSDSAHGSSRSPVSHQPSSRGSPISESSSSVPIVMSSAQLKKISTNLHRHLSRLMEVILKRDEERAHLQTELSRIQNQITASLRAATAKRSQSSSGPGRPAGRRPPPPSLALASVSEHSLASQSGGAQPLNETSGKAKPGSRPQSGRSEGGIQSEDDWSSRPSSWLSAGSSSEGILDVGDETDHSEPSATLVPVPVVMERLEVVEAGSQQSLENITGAESDLKEQSDLYSDTNKPNNSGSR